LGKVRIFDQDHLTEIATLVEVELVVRVSCFVNLADGWQVDQRGWQDRLVELKTNATTLMNI
jgi:hypothetical protein